MTILAVGCGDTAGGGNNTAEQEQKITHTPDPLRELYIGALSVVEDAKYVTWHLVNPTPIPMAVGPSAA